MRTLQVLFLALLAGVAALAGASGAAAQGGPAADRVTGTVAYRERISLPPNATLTVQLVDVSLADAPATVIAEQTIDTAGRQPPFAFELPYDATTIQPNGSYAVQARITAAGQLLFATTTRYAVITRGNPTAIDVMLERVGVSGPETMPGTGGTERSLAPALLLAALLLTGGALARRGPGAGC